MEEVLDAFLSRTTRRRRKVSDLFVRGSLARKVWSVLNRQRGVPMTASEVASELRKDYPELKGNWKRLMDGARECLRRIPEVREKDGRFWLESRS